MSEAAATSPDTHTNAHPHGSLASIVERFRPSLTPFEAFYRDLHQNPELPTKERRTASVVAEKLRSIGYTEVHENIGGYGLVAVFRNGPGKTILIRSELDALPVCEKTELSYASKVRMQDAWGAERPVMHACAHDMHATCLLAASTLLHSAQDLWSGTLLILFQPNEEYLGGAQAMIDDGLYDKVPVPDLVLGQHVVPLESGTLAFSTGPVLAAADSVDIRVNSSGPGVNAQDNIDPILVAAHILVRVNTMEISPKEMVVLQCRQFHSGWPGADYRPYADLNIDVKTYTPAMRTQVLKGIERIVKAECSASGIEDKPEIKLKVRAPLTSSTPETVHTIRKTFSAHLKATLVEQRPKTSCEDFSILATSKNRPYAYWTLGGIDHDLWHKAQNSDSPDAIIPNNHSSYYVPVIQPTMRVGTDAMALAVLTFLAKDR
ncbi:hypothetical protein MMC27_000076 [Xylographa pallens]|nr:hypothetical protein [Xylographa pallens]